MNARVVVVLLAALASRAAADPAPPPCTDDAQLDGPTSKQHRVDPRAYVGKSPKAIVAAHGEPGCKSAERWRYWLPEGCAYEKDVVTLRFAHGVVTRATVVHVYTGEECM